MSIKIELNSNETETIVVAYINGRIVHIDENKTNYLEYVDLKYQLEKALESIRVQFHKFG